MDYNVKTKVLLEIDFNTEEFNVLMYESAKPYIIDDIKSIIKEDTILSRYIDGDLTFCFESHYKILLKYCFSCNDENETEAESFSRSCVEDIRSRLEDKGITIKKISCKAEEMDMGWLDCLEDNIFG